MTTLLIAFRDDATCPAGAREMMGPVHRVGCSTKACRGVRAECYVRTQHEPDEAGRPVVRARYVCRPCGLLLSFAAVVGDFARETPVAFVSARPVSDEATP